MYMYALGPFYDFFLAGMGIKVQIFRLCPVYRTRKYRDVVVTDEMFWQ